MRRAAVQGNLFKRLVKLKDTGCGILVVLLLTLPLWVLSISMRGPVFAIGALVVLALIVFGIGWLNKLLGKD
jgi:hypothetical protein